MKHTITCQARADFIENEMNELSDEEEAVLFVELPLNGFPGDGEDQVCFIDNLKDPLEL